MDMSVF